MERTHLDDIEQKLNRVYNRAMKTQQLPQALDSIRGLMELVEMRAGEKREVGFGNSED